MIIFYNKIFYNLRLTFSGSNDFNNSLSMKKLFKNCNNIKELNILFSSTICLQAGLESPLKYLPINLISLSLYRPSICKYFFFVFLLINLIYFIYLFS